MDKGSASKWAAAGAANHDSSWYSGSAPECSGIRCVLKAAICRPFDISGVFATAAGRIAEAWLTLEQTMEPLNLARVNCLNAKSSEERVVYKKAELNRNVDSENNHGGSSRTYVLHRTGCSQEDDQLLRQGCERSGSPGRPDRSNALGTGRLDEDASATLDRSHGSHDFHRLDLRSSAPARSAGEGSASADAARHRCGQEEERSHRCRQDRRLPALRLPTGMPHGIHRDSRQTPNPALPTPAGAPDGADEESDLRSADGNRSEPQQAAAAQSGVFPRATLKQRRGE